MRGKRTQSGDFWFSDCPRCCECDVYRSFWSLAHFAVIYSEQNLHLCYSLSLFLDFLTAKKALHFLRPHTRHKLEMYTVSLLDDRHFSIICNGDLFTHYNHHCVGIGIIAHQASHSHLIESQILKLYMDSKWSTSCLCTTTLASHGRRSL